MGKGSRDRTTNLKAYRDNPFWDKAEKEKSEKMEYFVEDNGKFIRVTGKGKPFNIKVSHEDKTNQVD